MFTIQNICCAYKEHIEHMLCIQRSILFVVEYVSVRVHVSACVSAGERVSACVSASGSVSACVSASGSVNACVCVSAQVRAHV